MGLERHGAARGGREHQRGCRRLCARPRRRAGRRNVRRRGEAAHHPPDERGAAWLVFSEREEHRAPRRVRQPARRPRTEGSRRSRRCRRNRRRLSEGEASQKGVSAEKSPLAPLHSRFVRRFRDAPPMIHASMTWDHAIFVDRRGGVGVGRRRARAHGPRPRAPRGPALAGPLDRGALARVRVERAACGRRHTAFVATDGALSRAAAGRTARLVRRRTRGRRAARATASRPRRGRGAARERLARVSFSFSRAGG